MSSVSVPCQSVRQVVGIDLREAVGIALLLPTSRSPPNWPQPAGAMASPQGAVEMGARRVVDQRLDEGAVRAEFIHDAARGRLVRERDEEGLVPLTLEVLDVERGVAGWETSRNSGP